MFRLNGAGRITEGKLLLSGFIMLGGLIPPLHAQSTVDVWTITADSLNPANYNGVTVANGMIGIISSPDLFRDKQVMLNGAYDVYAKDDAPCLLNTFNIASMAMDIDGVPMETRTPGVSNIRQVLDLKHAHLTTSFDYADGSGPKASVRYTWSALRQLPYSMLIDVTVTAKREITITPATIVDAPESFSNVEVKSAVLGHGRLINARAKSPSGALEMSASQTFLFPDPEDSAPRVKDGVDDRGRSLLEFTKSIPAGATAHFSIVASVMSSAQTADPYHQAIRATLFAVLQGHDRLVAGHERAWDKLWQSDIVIKGDDSTERDVHNMLYHLYSFARAGTGYSLYPMGLSGQGYDGHTFWDTEIWMYPPLLLLHPEIAKSLIEYRYQRLAAAERNALAHGYEGAMFPWESAATGDEETGVVWLTGPFEHHITGDVGFAAWNFYCVTHDTAWLRTRGYPILQATADFWVSRVVRTGPGHYDIDNVVAADEYAENVDNNAFTNAAARANLEAAVAAAKVLRVRPNPDWQRVHDNIPILHSADGVTLEYAGYKGVKIKQADVNLLAYPFHEVVDSAAIHRDLAYYLPRVDAGGPAMTQSIFAVLYARLGMPDSAYQTFKRGYVLNRCPPFGVLGETAGGCNPYFATAAGGLMQTMLNGFGGLEITPAGIVQHHTKLPKGWTSLTLTGIGPDHRTFEVHE